MQRWLDEEKDYLIDTYGRLTDAEIGAHLGRKPTALREQAKALGINRRMAIYSARDVGRLFGVSVSTVIRWRRRRIIRARRSIITIGAHRCWDFNEDEIERFVREAPWVYDVHLMTPGEYLTNVARAIAKADPYLTTDEAAAIAGVGRWTINDWCRKGMACQRRYTAGGSWRGVHVVRRSDLLAWIGAHRGARALSA